MIMIWSQWWSIICIIIIMIMHNNDNDMHNDGCDYDHNYDNDYAQ